jgi:hypothetical protein
MSIGTGIAGVGVARSTKCVSRRELFRGGPLFAAWSVAFAAVLYESLRNVSNIRSDMGRAKTDAIGRYERASAELARPNADRDAAKRGMLWETSASCMVIDRETDGFAITLLA